jgi:molybdopterin-containing oxidoreductase family iron-sulfur binding subunit
VVFYPDASLYDGRYANNGWMQEAPDPMTKLVWDNAALVSARTAGKLGVVNGDMLSMEFAGAKVEMPAMVMPGHADDSISLSLGYGRAACGRVGQGVGRNAGPLRTLAGFHIAKGVNVRKTGAKYQLVTTQEHHTMVEPITGLSRPIVLEASAERYNEHPDFARHAVHLPEMVQMFPDFDYSKGYQWGLAIDLNACVGCNACLVACQAENNIPIVGKDQVRRGREMHWIRMDRYYTGSSEDPQVVWQPLACVQCERAPCESVCPVAATVHSPEGLNEMAYNRCVGTRYCANNCPYKVRYYNWHNFAEPGGQWEAWPEPLHLLLNPDVTVREKGVMEKCTFCVQRIRGGQNHARLEDRSVRDGEIAPACAQTCPSDAIVFGDLNDPASRVHELAADPRAYHVLAGLNTKPGVSYLARVVHGEVPAGAGAHEEH